MEAVATSKTQAAEVLVDPKNNCKFRKRVTKKQIRKICQLIDAKYAGTQNAINCTLILTDEPLMKSYAVCGLETLGRDRYGVFLIPRNILDIRKATLEQVMTNVEVKNLIAILGLQCDKKYENVDDLKSLRYGHLMIMTDPNEIGSYFKGLVIYLIAHNWPSLIRLPFLEIFILPTVRATRGYESLSFYSEPEFEEWKSSTTNWSSYYLIKRYRGMSSMTLKEAPNSFSDFFRHRIAFKFSGDHDDKAIQMAFSKDCIEKRKEWLAFSIQEIKRRHQSGLPQLYLYEKETTKVSYSEFINKELVFFFKMERERRIPSLIDGLNVDQRKVLYTCICIERNVKKQIKVCALIDSVLEKSAYPYNETNALTDTIVYMAQEFVGSNNINILLPHGNFGSRFQVPICFICEQINDQHEFSIENNIFLIRPIL